MCGTRHREAHLDLAQFIALTKSSTFCRITTSVSVHRENDKVRLVTDQVWCRLAKTAANWASWVYNNGAPRAHLPRPSLSMQPAYASPERPFVTYSAKVSMTIYSEGPRRDSIKASNARIRLSPLRWPRVSSNGGSSLLPGKGITDAWPRCCHHADRTCGEVV